MPTTALMTALYIVHMSLDLWPMSTSANNYYYTITSTKINSLQVVNNVTVYYLVIADMAYNDCDTHTL